MSIINVAVAGVRGRMGSAIVSVLPSNPAFNLIGGFSRSTSSDMDGLIDRDTALETADVILDFTVGSAAAELAEVCAARGGPALVIGATGFDAADLEKIRLASRRLPIVRSGNFSIGINYLLGLVSRVAKDFGPDVWDIEILEAHHRHKLDVPSGTALMLGEAAAHGRGVPLSSVEAQNRSGLSGERTIGEIGFAAIRGGGIVGEHSVVFAAPEEVITLSHSALDRGMFVRGALAAAHWIIDRESGEYSMQDVLGFSPAGKRAD